MVKAILLALSLTLINAGSSFFLGKYAMKKDWKQFNKLVFGSMTVRYFFTAGFVWVVLRYMEMDKLAFGLTFLISTFVLIIVEILFIHNMAKSVKLNNKKLLS